MSRLKLRVTREGELVFGGDADECTVHFADEQNEDNPVVSVWGDGEDGLLCYFPDDTEPWPVTPTEKGRNL